MKKLLAMLVTSAMALSLAACGGSADTSAPAESAAPASEAAEAAETAESGTAGEGLKICIVTSSGIDDGSFNQNCYDGIMAFLENHPDCTVQDVKEPDLAKLIPTVDDLAGDYDVFVLPGFNFAACGDVVVANPDKKFIVVDSTITDSENNPIEGDNYYTMTFAEQQSAFPVGVAAALSTKTGKVAVVNGMAYPSNVNYQYGFMAGVKYAVEKFGAKAECVELPSYAGTDVMGNSVGGNYIGAFDDEATGKEVAKNLIDEGVDVMLVAAGASGNGCYAAAKEAEDVFVIGCDVDQWADGAVGDRNVILTSTLKIMDQNVEKQLNAIYDGTFEGQDAYLDASNNGVGYVTTEGHHQMSEDTLAKVAEAFAAMQEGKVEVPADATVNDLTPDDFPMG